MDALLAMFYMFRPIMFIDLPWGIGNMNIPELFAAASTALLGVVFIYNAIIHKRLIISSIDFFIVFYCTWCAFVYALYMDKSSLEEMAKFTLPFFTYIVMKNSIHDREHYCRLLRYMIIGFSVPVVASAFLIVQGKGLDRVLYWTGLARFQGVYVNPHNMGHSMAFFIMILVIGFALSRKRVREKALGAIRLWTIYLGTTGMAAMYCLYKSYVRTTFLGLGIFFTIFLYKYNKKLLFMAGATLAVLVVVYAAVVSTIFVDVVETLEGSRKVERIGSGRPYIWKHNLKEFSSLTLDRQLAGVGIGNRRGIFQTKAQVEDIWNSHNDWLEVMMQTGIIGFIIYCAMQFCFLRAILRLEGVEKVVFLALFITVGFMNFVSNSYVVRFGIGQMYYMVLAFIEIPKERAT